MPNLNTETVRLRVACTVLLCLCAVSPFIFGGEAAPSVPAPKPTGPESDSSSTVDVALEEDSINQLEDIPDMSWWAAEISWAPEKRAIVLSGSAWVRFKEYKVEADRIVYFVTSGDVYAEGNVRLRLGESEVAAQIAYLNKFSQQGYLIDATVRGSLPAGEASEPQQRLDLPNLSNSDEQFAKATDGEAAFLKTKDPYGVYLDVVDDPQARLRFVFKAEKVILHSRMHLSATDAFVTTDDMAQPLYGVKIGQLDLKMREVPNPENPNRTILKPKVITGERARIKIGPVALFPFPKITYDMSKHMGFAQAEAGNSKQWGPYFLYRIGWGLGGREDRLFDPSKLYFDADMRLNRGPAFGSEFNYKTGRRPSDPEASRQFERGHGKIRVYGTWETFTTNEDDMDRAVRHRERRVQPKIDGFPRVTYDANMLFAERRRLDDAGPPSFGLDLYEDDERWMLDFGHHQPLRHFVGLNDVELDFKYQRQSDRDFLLDYFPKNYMTANQPEALVSARKAGDHFSAELLYRGNPQNFDGAPPRQPIDFGTFTTYEPALSYALMPMNFGPGFYVNAEAQAAHLRREFEQRIINQDDLEANRIYSKVSIERPFKFWGINTRPHFGGQLAGYDDSRGEGSTSQGALLYGVDVSTRLYGAFEGARNEELGVHGFRHIIEPRFEYLAVGDTLEDPLKILDFDEVDDLQGAHRLRFALEQTFQTKSNQKDGSYGVRNFAGLNLSIDAYPRDTDQQRLLDSDVFDLFKVNGYLRVIEALTFSGEAGINLEDGDVEKAVFNLTFDPGGRWRVQVYERFNFEDTDRKILGSDLLGYKLDFQLSERWGLSIGQENERRKGFLAKKGKNSFNFALHRKYGPLVGSVSYRVDRNFNDSSFGFSLAPSFAYRNLILPNQDLLVPEGEVDDLPAQQRNFDPFNLLNKSKGKAKESKPKKDSAPAPPPPDAQKDSSSAPGQPAEVAEQSRTSGPAGTDVAASSGKANGEPYEAAIPPLKQVPENLERDDWVPAPRR